MSPKKPKNSSTGKSKLDKHQSSNICMVICTVICIGVLLGLILYCILTPIILKIVQESSGKDLVNYIKSLGVYLIIWISGYWCPPIPFLPKK